MQDRELAKPSIDPVSDILKWILLVIAIICFGLLGWATVLTYEKAPPHPQAFTDRAGNVIMSADDIIAGKGGFQKADLMDYGSIYGMGSYFGEDYTASTLVRLGVLTKQSLPNTGGTPPGRRRQATSRSRPLDPPALRPSPRLRPQHRRPKRSPTRPRLRRCRSSSRGSISPQPTVVLPDSVAQAVRALQGELTTKLNTVNLSAGWVPAKSLDPVLRKQTADFIIYSAITTVARRPDHPSTSWTENWPYEPSVGNTPTTNTFQWTWISFCFTFFAMGFVLWLYRAYLDHPDDEPMERGLAEYRALTPSQIKTSKYFIVVALVFLAMQGAGAIMAHSYYDRETFYGVQLNYILPYNFLRSFHLQAPIIWIGLGWIASGLFIAPAIAGGREAKGQGFLVDLLFWVSLFVVAAALTGNYLGIQGVIDKGWFWFGNQGLSYIQLGRFWQILFFVALLSWSGLMFRALWPSRDTLMEATRQFWTGKIRLEHLIWAATINVAVLYIFGMIPLTGIEKSFTITDFWRWWVVHLWVEQSFEFFAVAMSAYLLMSLGLVSRKLAERSVYLELILIFLGGVLGTGHHLYWGGGPSMWVPLGLDVLVHRGPAARAADPGSHLAAPADQRRRGVRLRSRLPLHPGLGLLEFRRGGRVRRWHAQCAARQLLRARDIPYAQPRPYVTVRRIRPARARVDLFLPALPCRSGCGVRRTAGADRLLVLQHRPADVDIPPLLSDRLAAAQCRVRAWVRLGTEPSIL